MKKTIILAVTAAVLLPLIVLAQKNAGGTADISAGSSWEDAYYRDVPTLTDVATQEHVNPLIGEFSKACKDNADAIDATTKKVATKVSAPRNSGMTQSMRDRGNALIKEGKDASAWSRRLGNWADKTVKFLKAVDFVSSMAKVAGHLWEGDKTGATSVAVNEISKKTCSGAGAFTLSGVPVVGPAAGAAAGEEFHNRYVKPLVDARENEMRNNQAMKNMLGKPWLPPNLYINPDGNLVTFPDEYFFNPKSGRMDSRSEKEQKEYEDAKHVEWFNGKQLADMERKALSGEITPEQYGKALESWRRRDKTKRWQPADENESEQEIESEDDKDKEEQTSDDEDNEDQEEDEDEPDKPKDVGGILDKVNPEKVTATGKTEEDLSAEGFTNIATTTFTLTFWNVGGMAQGYGGASLVSVTTFTMHPAVEKNTCSGFFSGGPDGYFTLNCGGDSMTLRMRGGQAISGGGVSLNVQNPGAFANWPR